MGYAADGVKCFMWFLAQWFLGTIFFSELLFFEKKFEFIKYAHTHIYGCEGGLCLKMVR